MRKLCAVLLLAATALPAAAALAVPTTVEQLTRGSDAVVRGGVAKVTSRWIGKRIFTFAEVEVSSVWSGSAKARIRVMTPGGVVGDLGQRVEGAAVFTAGEEVVLFLSRAERGAYRVNGLAQGKLTVQGEVARPALAHTDFRAAALPAAERRSEEMSLAELERRVRSAR